MTDTLTGRVGILGGCFNPIHMGHLILAQSALEQFELSRVLFIPSATPPHKSATGLADARHRLAMVQAAIECHPAFEVSDIELRRDGPSYSVDTVQTLKEHHPSAEFIFIIGGDSLTELHQWKNIYTLLEACRIVTFVRPGSEIHKLAEADLRLRPPWPDRLRKDIRMGRQIDISSSEIRHRIAEGMSIRYLVPFEVEIYITDFKLYAE